MKSWLFLCCFLRLAFLEAVIVEFSHFQDLPSYVAPEDLVIVDIDDTLLIPVQMLGCDEWFQHRMKSYANRGVDWTSALKKALDEWEAVRYLTEMEIVEPGTEKVIRSLQEERVCVMGLTTQRLAIAAKTSQQLLEQQIDLSRTAPIQRDHYFQLAGAGILYKDGILSTAGKDKGEALFRFCDDIHYTPRRIIFINDKAAHLAEIETAAEKRNIAFIGLRYSYSDARKKMFRPEIADYQFSHSSLTRLLSDQEVSELVD